MGGPVVVLRLLLRRVDLGPLNHQLDEEGTSRFLHWWLSSWAQWADRSPSTSISHMSTRTQLDDSGRIAQGTKPRSSSRRRRRRRSQWIGLMLYLGRSSGRRSIRLQWSISRIKVWVKVKGHPIVLRVIISVGHGHIKDLSSLGIAVEVEGRRSESKAPVPTEQNHAQRTEDESFSAQGQVRSANTHGSRILEQRKHEQSICLLRIVNIYI